MTLKTMIPAAAAFALTATLAWAQPPATQTPAKPAPTTPAPTGQPPATQMPAPSAQPPALKPPAPFPQDSKIAFVDINAVAANSTAGREAANKLKALQDKKLAEINDKNKQLQATQAKLNTGGSVLNDTARARQRHERHRPRTAAEGHRAYAA